MIVSGNGVYLWVRNNEQAATYDLMFYHQQNGTFSKVLGAVQQSCENNRPHRFQEQSIGNLFYFQAPVGTIYDYSCQLWVSDGTVAGTKAVDQLCQVDTEQRSYQPNRSAAQRTLFHSRCVWL